MEDNRNSNRPIYRGDYYPESESAQEAHHQARYAAEQEIQEELNNELNKEYKDLFVPTSDRTLEQEIDSWKSGEDKDALFNRDSDGVDRSHYRTAEFEPIEIIEEYKLNFNLGNAIKYILRAPFKGQETSDLKKARWYLDRELSNGNK